MASPEEETKPVAFQNPGSLTTSKTKFRLPTYLTYDRNNYTSRYGVASQKAFTFRNVAVKFANFVTPKESLSDNIPLRTKLIRVI